MGLITKIILGVIGFAVFGNVVSLLVAQDSPKIATPSSPTSPSSAVREQAAVAAAWTYSTQKDDMSGKSASYATSTSKNRNDLHFPYGPNIGARLVLRKHPRWGMNAYVELDKGQILCRSYENCRISVKFDQEPPVTYEGRGPSDGSSDFVFIKNEPSFIAQLKRHKAVVIELPMYQDGNQTWKFDVGSLQWQQ